MSYTILFDDHQYQTDNGAERAGALWLPEGELKAATGWTLETRGLCRGASCIPVPAGARWVEGGQVNVSAFAAHRGQGAARDGSTVFAFGMPAGVRFDDGPAPDFELPDFSGRIHRLSQYRGKKVLLMTWASW